MLWDTIPVPKGTDADFAVAVTDDSLAPWIKKGGTAYLRRRTLGRYAAAGEAHSPG